MTKTGAIRFTTTGGPEVLVWEQIDLGPPGAGEVLLRHTAIGLNYIDSYHRSGLYPVPLPSGLGGEAAGIVEAVGAGVGEVKVGDRVVYCSGPLGAYAEHRLIAADHLIKLPPAIDGRVGAAALLQGLTAWYLVRRTHVVKPGETVLVHAAAGGVGLIMVQWAKHLGATVIGTVGSDEKAALASRHGCDHTILYRHEKVSDRVRELTGGKGVPVVYDGVGKDTFVDSLDCLAPLGLMVSYGNASGAVPPLDILTLTRKGSLFLTRPTLGTYTPTRQALEAATDELFGLVAAGTIKIEINQTFALKDAALAHRAIESRATTGKTLLLP
jgi:NADPH2:quinone reductase